MNHVFFNLYQETLRALSAWSPCGRISAKIQLPLQVSTHMKTSITCLLGINGYIASGWTGCRMDFWRRYWGTYSTHKCGWGLALFVSLLLHNDNHYSTQQSSLDLVLPGQGILNLLARRRFWEWWRIRWTYFHLVLAGRGLFVSFRLYISTVEYPIK